MLTNEFYRNYERIKKEFPRFRVLTVKEMRRYLGMTPRRVKNTFGIDGRLTVESFRRRLSERRNK